MVHPKLRRALAASALAAALSLVPAAGANAAAVRERAPRTHAAAFRGEAGASWLRDLVIHLLEKAGVRIDPDGNH